MWWQQSKPDCILKLYTTLNAWFVGIAVIIIVLCSMWMEAAWEHLFELVLVESSGILPVYLSQVSPVILQQLLTFCLQSLQQSTEVFF